MSVANINQFRFTQPLTVSVFHRINTYYRNLSCFESKSSKFSMLLVNLTETQLKFFEHTVRLFIGALPTFIHMFSCAKAVYKKRMVNFTEIFENTNFYIIICIIIQTHNIVTYSEQQKNSSHSLFYARIHQIDNSSANLYINNVTYRI